MIRRNPEAIAIGAILFLGMGGWLLDSAAAHMRRGFAPFQQEFRIERDNFRVERDRFRIEHQDKLRMERDKIRNESEKLRDELRRAFCFRHA